MTQQIINTGTGPNAADGDSLYVAFTKVNDNFNSIWAQGPVDSNISIANNAIVSTDVNGNIVLMPNGIGYAQINATAIPGANNTYFLGDSSRRWRGIWAGSAGVNTTGNVYAGNLVVAGTTTYLGDLYFDGNLSVTHTLSAAGNIVGDSNLNIAGDLTAGPATFGGNVAITGNLQVAGNIIYIDVEQLRVHDPVIEIGTGPNGAPLTTSDGYSRGLLMDYFNTTANTQQLGFMGLAGPNYTTYQFLTNATDAGNVFTGTPANLTFGNATASGVLSATGNVIGGNIVTVGNVSATANVTGANLLTGGNISAAGDVIGNTLYANTSISSGNSVSAAGNITGAYILGNGRYLSGIDTTLIANGTSRVQVVATDGNIIANVAGNTIGLWTASGYSVAGNIEFSNYAVGNGRYLTGVVADNIGNVLANISVSGNANVGNLNTGGIVSATGNITGNYILGNGHFLSGIDTSLIANGTSNVHIATANGNVTMSVNGTANVVEVSTNGIYVGGIISTTGNAIVDGILTDNYYYANGQPLDMQQPAGSNTWVQYNYNNDFGATDAFTFDSSANALAVSGNITGGNLRTAGLVSAAGNVTGGNLRTTGALVAGTGSFLSDVAIYGNLQVSGNIIYVDVTELRVVDPVIELGGGPNGTPLVTNDGFSRGLKLDYFNTVANAAQFGFMGLAATDYTTYQFLTNATDTANTFSGTAANLYFGNASVTGNIATSGILTDGYYYANGQPLDMQQPSGSNTWIQYNDNGNFGATTNFTFDADNQVFYIGGFATITGNIIGGNLQTAGYVSATGNVTGGNIIGTFVSPAANTQVLFNDTGVIGGNSQLTFNKNGNTLSVGTTGGTVRAAYISTPQAGVDLTLLPSTGITRSYGNLVPQFANTYDLGGSGTRWNNIWGNVANIVTLNTVGNITGGNLSISGIASVTGNAAVGGILTDNYYYANGSPVDFQQPAGSNTQIQFNSNDNFGASANLTFNSSTNQLYVAGPGSFAGNIVGGNLRTAGSVSATGNIDGGNLSGEYIIGTISTSAQTNITSLGTLTGLTVNGTISATGNITGNVVTGNVLSSTGNAYIGGNLYVTGNVTYINITDLNVQDPIISMGRGPNNTPLTVNDGYDRGEQLWYYTTSEKSAFIGWDNSTNNLVAALDVTNNSEVITVNNWGNFVVGNLYTRALSSANLLFVNTSSNVVTVGNSTVTAGATFAVNATNSMLVPVGNSFQRPGSPAVGMIRFNTTLDAFEYYSDVDGWVVSGTGGSTSLTSQTFTADGSTLSFTLTNASTTVDSLVMINGVTQIPSSSYSIVGTTLTFTESPEAGDTIEVREISAQSTVHAITNSSGNASVSVNDSAANVDVQGNIVLTGNVYGNVNGYAIGYRDVPQVSFTGNATIGATDAGKHYYSTLSTANTLTIANNTSVSWQVGTAITVVNCGTGNITLTQGTGVSLYLAGNSTAANRVLTTYGMATLLNVAANVWMVNGTGVV